jgi:hypothetical protein
MKRTYEENIALAKVRVKSKKPVELSEFGASSALVKTDAEEPSQHLPLWSEQMRGVPNSVLRSALFGAIKRGRRVFHQREPLASVKGVTVLFTGPRLDQADLDVWEQCLHIARNGSFCTRIQFSVSGFLKEIGRSTGGQDIEWLKGAFARLSSSVVEIKDGGRAYFGPMLYGGARDDETGRYSIEINPSIVKLYGTDGWSSIEVSERKSLKGQPLAQWLHGFYSTHANPFAFKVETIHHLCGSENKQLPGFKRELMDSLDKLSVVTGWLWKIDGNDLVHITKTEKDGQARHQVKKLSTGTG